MAAQHLRKPVQGPIVTAIYLILAFVVAIALLNLVEFKRID